jgi:adenylate cyclase
MRSLPDPDELLAASLAGVPSIGAFAFSDSTRNVDLKQPAGIASAGDDPRKFVAQYTGATPNLPVLEQAFAGFGFVNFEPEIDGIVRRVPLLAVYREALYPSFAAETLRVVQGALNYTVKSSGASGEKSLGVSTGIVAIKIGNAIAATDATGALILYDSGHRAERFVSAASILDGTVDPGLLAGKIVVIGATAAALRDIRATPLSPSIAGVEIQAQLLEQMIGGEYLYRPDWANGLEITYLALIGIAMIAAIRGTGAAGSALVAIGVAALSIALSWAAFHFERWLVDPISPLIAAFAVYLSGSLVGYLRTEAERRQNRLVLGQYLPPRLVERYSRNMDALRLGGETRELTILFTDIRGFTTIAETMDPGELTRLINEFLTPMTRIIQEQCDGTVDKYIGDCIMAFWNAPHDDPDHARHALDAALAMRHELDRLNRHWIEAAESAGRTFDPLRIGIGVNTGRCTAGNFGSEQRFGYSALGDSVNLASRLESLSRMYGVDIVVGAATARAVSGFALLEIDRVRVKGRMAPESIYALLGHGDAVDADTAAAIGAFDAMLASYRSCEWDKAAAALDAVRQTAPALAPLCDLYENRIRAYVANPPEAGWDGVFVAGSKAG